MRESLNEPVSVIWYYNASKQHVQPFSLSWKSRDYRLGKVDFWHKTRRGTTLLHHFSLSDREGTVYFKLLLDTDSLHWTIEEFMYAGDVTVAYESPA
jgi:hypothetical protein